MNQYILSQAASQHGFSRDDMEKMVSDATFYFLVADQKKSLIKVCYYFQKVKADSFNCRELTCVSSVISIKSQGMSKKM